MLPTRSEACKPRLVHKSAGAIKLVRRSAASIHKLLGNKSAGALQPHYQSADTNELLIQSAGTIELIRKSAAGIPKPLNNSAKASQFPSQSAGTNELHIQSAGLIGRLF